MIKRFWVLLLLMGLLSGCLTVIKAMPVALPEQKQRAENGQTFVEATKKHRIRVWTHPNKTLWREFRIHVRVENKGTREVTLDPERIKVAMVSHHKRIPLKVTTYEELVRRQEKIFARNMAIHQANLINVALLPFMLSDHIKKVDALKEGHKKSLTVLRLETLKIHTLMPGSTYEGVIRIYHENEYLPGGYLDLRIPFDFETYRFRLRMEKV